jgi:hypothetical protein
MTKPAATIHVEHNPQTGKLRPFEVYFTTDRGGKQFSGSYSKMTNAQAAAKKMEKKNSDWYDVTLAA